MEQFSVPVACGSFVVQRREAARDEPDRAPTDGFTLAADLQLHARDELCAALGISIAEAHSLGDDGCVLRAYQRWGLGSADRFLGEGAFVLWDEAARRLVCWRDIAGVRPLYYHHVPGRRFVFSSDLRSISAHPEVPDLLDLSYTRAIVANDNFQHPTRTLVDGVHKLPPGHLLVVDRTGAGLQRYWDPESVPIRVDADDRECAAELRALLHDAIAARVERAAGGVGAHLSGGLDSSSIAVMTSRALTAGRDEFQTFSWAPPWEVVPRVTDDERDLVELVCERESIRHRYTRLELRDPVDVLYRDLALRPNEALLFEIATSRLAVEAGVRTIFSGWGGDELLAFNGRGYFADLARRGRLPTVQRELRRRAAIHGGSILGAWKGRVLIPLLPDAVVSRGAKELGPLPAELRSDFAHILGGVEPLEDPVARERPGVRRMQLSLLRHGHLHHRTEAWAAHGASLGLTYTFPLLDRRIVEFALSLPGRMYFRDGWKRWLCRTAMEGILPDALCWNPAKFDTAAETQLHTVMRDAVPHFKARLREHRDNPLVDVQVILDEQDRQERLRALPDDGPPPLPSQPVGRAAWLAFTQLRPP
jgi:asparagine synthase (glutamine-hydrolysing)